MVKLMTKAETALSEAQDRNQTPFIDSALEQLKSATTELNNAMKRVSENVFFWESKVYCKLLICLDFWSLGDNEQKRCSRRR